jgi:hypothetical protein
MDGEGWRGMLCAKKKFGISWLPRRCKQRARQNLSSLHSTVCVYRSSCQHIDTCSLSLSTVIDWFVFFSLTTAFVCDQMGLIKLPTGCFTVNI